MAKQKMWVDVLGMPEDSDFVEGRLICRKCGEGRYVLWAAMCCMHVRMQHRPMPSTPAGIVRR